MANNINSVTCPSCNNSAKESMAYPGVYVCKCLGYVEDISKMKKTDSFVLPDNRGNFLREIKSAETSSLRVQELSTVETAMAAGKELNIRTEFNVFAQFYMKEGRVFQVYKNNKPAYCLWVRHNKLVLDGSFFLCKDNQSPTKEQCDDFKELAKMLIKKGVLSQNIFEDLSAASSVRLLS